MCKYCSFDELDGFNIDIINEYNKDVGVSIELLGSALYLEFDKHCEVFEWEVKVNYCPMCGKGLFD